MAASHAYDWKVDPVTVVSIWRGGCIIRAELLNEIAAALRSSADTNLLAATALVNDVNAALPALRRMTALAVTTGLPTPCLTSGISYIDMLRTPRLSTAMIQGLRDYFGAHTYERVDAKGIFHTDWSGERSERQLDL
jgi:6-phosphogluconate dehydrogenase